MKNFLCSTYLYEIEVDDKFYHIKVMNDYDNDVSTKVYYNNGEQVENKDLLDRILEEFNKA